MSVLQPKITLLLLASFFDFLTVLATFWFGRFGRIFGQLFMWTQILRNWAVQLVVSVVQAHRYQWHVVIGKFVQIELKTAIW